jgi:tetratricopeptide (TPR) repeat protein
MTEAHDVLTNRLARAEYEAYLQARGRTGSGDPGSEPDAFENLERLLSQAERQSRDRPEDDAAAVASDETVDRVSRMVPPPLPPRDSRLSAPSVKPPPLPTGSLPPEPVRMVDDPAARRQALARKLGLAPPPTTTAEDKEEAQRAQSMRQRAVAKDLRNRYQHRKTDISDQRVGRYIAAVEESLAAGNPVSALNAVKIAHTFIEPGTSLAGRLQQLETEASALLADSYLERARYEETNGHYEEAARSYTRSARGRPSSDVLRSAAECYLKAGTDLRQAGELAREAVQIAPKRVDLRMTLAKVYETAGMAQSATQELTRALEMAPENDRIKQWLKRLQRGGV